MDSGGLEHVIVLDRCGTDPPMAEGRDLRWADVIAGQPEECEP